MFGDEDFYSYEYEEELSQPLLNVDDQNDHSITEISSPPPQLADSDNSIAYSTSITQSRHFLLQNLGIPTSAFRHSDVCGLIVLRLKDFGLIRQDSRSHRVTPHLLILPTQDFDENHPDFFAALNALS